MQDDRRLFPAGFAFLESFPGDARVTSCYTAAIGRGGFRHNEPSGRRAELRRRRDLSGRPIAVVGSRDSVGAGDGLFVRSGNDGFLSGGDELPQIREFEANTISSTGETYVGNLIAPDEPLQLVGVDAQKTGGRKNGEVTAWHDEINLAEFARIRNANLPETDRNGRKRSLLREKSLST